MITQSTSGPSLPNSAWAKSLRLRTHPYFHARAELPPSRSRRQRQASAEAKQQAEEQFKKWEGTTPHGREIMRKRILEFKQHLDRSDFRKQIEVLRLMVPHY